MGLHDRLRDLRGQLPGRADGPRPGRGRARADDRVTTVRRPVAGRPGPPGPARRPRRRQARAGRRSCPTRTSIGRALRGQPRDRPRGGARPARGRLPDAPPRLGHVRDQGAAQPPRARHHGLLHGDDPRRRPRARRDRARQGRARGDRARSASCSSSTAPRPSWSSSACGSPTAARSSTRATASPPRCCAASPTTRSTARSTRCSRAPGTPSAAPAPSSSPTLADDELSRLLEVERGAPLLHIDQVDYDARGRAVMLSLEWHVADAFELIVNRRAS